MKKLTVTQKIGLVLVMLVVGVTLIGLFYTPYEPNKMDALSKNMAPSLAHPFGTDNFGRDILSRVMDGAKTTFLIAIATVVIGAVIGCIVGAITGYFGGIVDECLMRFNDVVASIPSILLALLVVSIMGIGKYKIIFALGIIFIPSFARVIRSEFVAQKQLDYVKNARLMGASHVRIMFLHIMPNTLPILLPSLAIGFNNAVLAEASMSYLGLGVQPPDPSLGRMLSDAQSFLLTAPWYCIAPGITIIITVLGFSLLVER
ncbi:MAG: ABC transporter permease [bacterium]|nr:ABC transporter permease [bacterium]